MALKSTDLLVMTTFPRIFLYIGVSSPEKTIYSAFCGVIWGGRFKCRFCKITSFLADFIAELLSLLLPAMMGLRDFLILLGFIGMPRTISYLEG